MLTAVGGILTETAVWPSKIFAAVLCKLICSVWFPLQGFSNKDVYVDGMMEWPCLEPASSLKDLLAFSTSSAGALLKWKQVSRGPSEAPCTIQ